MTTRTASCSCGQLRAEVTGEPIRVSVCHCYACQRRTGCVFAAQARFAQEAVNIQGQGTQFIRIGEAFRRPRSPSTRNECTPGSPCPETSSTLRSANFNNLLRAQHIFYPDRKATDALAGCVEDRVGDGRSHADERDLAQALDAERVDVRVLLVDEVRFEAGD